MQVDELARIVAEHTGPAFSGVVLLARGGEVLFEACRGDANRADAVPNHIDTRFQIASGCKIFTSVAICRLVQEGRLALDARLRDCVDADLPALDPGVTVHHLLTHTSGITSYFEEDVDPDYAALWNDRPVYRMREVADFLPLFADKPMKFAPGVRFDYNDAGYILLGLVVESVTGTRFRAHVETSIFGPAGMADSGYFAADRLPERCALAYIQGEDGGWRSNVFSVPAVGGPDGGAYVTAPDMARFWRALGEGALLDEATLGLTFDARTPTGMKPPHGHYGYGVWIDEQEGVRRKHFVEGADPGVAMRSALYPDWGMTLTIIGNTERAVWPLYRAIESGLGMGEPP